MDRWIGAAAIVVMINLLLKLGALAGFFIALRVGRSDDACHEFCFGSAFVVAYLWFVAEVAIAIPTMIGIAILLKRIAGGYDRLLAFAIPGLLFNVPLWLFALYWWAAHN